MPHESSQIPLDAGMWLDDLTPPSALARHSTSSLEDSLQHVAHAFGADADEDHDVHTLFPMLSETSFDYDEDAKTQHDHKADSAAAFPDDLSPILTAMPSPRTPKTPSAAKPTTPTKETHTKVAPPTANAPASIGVAIPFPLDHLAPTKAATPTPTTTTPTPTPTNRMRRRRLRSTTLSSALTQWTEHEQNVFFLVFKPKWAIAAPTTEQFAMLLLERFDAVGEKLSKTSHDAEAFYTTMLQAIIDLLDVVSPHDIDLLNPDEIRIALWCWHKLLGDSHKREEMVQIEDATDDQKKPLAQELLQSIVRSRRQMRKAKSATESFLPDEETQEMASLEGLLREALEHSSLPSYLYQLAPVDANATPVVHHPIVRKKSSKQQPPQQQPTATGHKRLRSESVELYHAFTNGTPLPARASSQNDPSQFVTPPVGNPSKKQKHESQSQTPHQSSGKKIYIKLRMVPRDTQTKTMVERCGCNPKVELKLSSTKKVSDVLTHMTKKWANVRSLVDAQATLHFFQKDSSAMSPEFASSANTTAKGDDAMKSWSRRTQDVTCLDIWRQSGKMKNDEYIAEVSYQWCVETKDASAEGGYLGGAWAVDDPSQLLDLLDRELANTTSTKKHLAFDQDECNSSRENSPFASPLNLNDPPTAPFELEHGAEHEKPQSLQAFSETVAFDTKSFADVETHEEQLSLASLPDDALSAFLTELSPDSQRRRRITPVLVATNECQI